MADNILPDLHKNGITLTHPDLVLIRRDRYDLANQAFYEMEVLSKMLLDKVIQDPEGEDLALTVRGLTIRIRTLLLAASEACVDQVVSVDKIRRDVLGRH